MASTPNPATQQDSAEAREYNRKRRWLEIADAGIGFLLLVVLLVTGWTTHLRDLALKVAGDRYALALFIYVVLLAALAKLSGAALEYYGFRLEHQHNLSNQRFRSWVLDEFKGWVVGIVLGTIVAELVYGLIRTSPQLWWIYAWLAFMVLFVLFAQIAPVVLFPLFYRFIPLENEELKSRLVRLSEAAGTRVRGVYEWKLSEKSKKANAALTGLGNTRRIILSDTLLQNYSEDEIEAVLAHELGHHVHRHIFKSIALQAAITFVGFWSASQVLNYSVKNLNMFSDVHDFANLPLLALVSSILSLLLLPALNAYSRHNERQADQYCWKAVPSVNPFITAMNKLSEQNLSERNPSRIVEVLFHSHPPVTKRVAAAQVFALAHPSPKPV
ncbi:MAG: Ste24 endopeptidase [Acidobacteriaceae bacterium]|nr:Ste24 endopeptidase [Acidobacteriaceae bacterium]